MQKSITRSASIGDDADPSRKCNFVCQLSGDQLTMQRSINGNTVALKLHREEDSKVRLTPRGFRWISRHPF